MSRMYGLCKTGQGYSCRFTINSLHVHVVSNQILEVDLSPGYFSYPTEILIIDRNLLEPLPAS